MRRMVPAPMWCPEPGELALDAAVTPNA
jgi:hypothetical protein